MTHNLLYASSRRARQEESVKSPPPRPSGREQKTMEQTEKIKLENDLMEHYYDLNENLKNFVVSTDEEEDDDSGRTNYLSVEFTNDGFKNKISLEMPINFLDCVNEIDDVVRRGI